MSFLGRLAARLRLPSLQRSDYSDARDRPIENTDALAAAPQHDVDGSSVRSGYPPGYVKAYDEGRPRT